MMRRAHILAILLSFAALSVSAQEVRAPYGVQPGGAASLGSLNVSGATQLGAATIIRVAAQFGGLTVANTSGQNIMAVRGVSASNAGAILSLYDTANNEKTVLRGDGGDSFLSGTLRAQMLVLSAAPTATNIPASGWTVVKRTDDASVKICANDAGTIKCVTMQ